MGNQGKKQVVNETNPATAMIANQAGSIDTQAILNNAGLDIISPGEMELLNGPRTMEEAMLQAQAGVHSPEAQESLGPEQALVTPDGIRIDPKDINIVIPDHLKGKNDAVMQALADAATGRFSYSKDNANYVGRPEKLPAAPPGLEDAMSAGIDESTGGVKPFKESESGGEAGDNSIMTNPEMEAQKEEIQRLQYELRQLKDSISGMNPQQGYRYDDSGQSEVRLAPSESLPDANLDEVLSSGTALTGFMQQIAKHELGTLRQELSEIKNVITQLPNFIGTQMRSQAESQTMLDRFFTNNPDLDVRGNTESMKAIAFRTAVDTIGRNNPHLSPEQVLNKAAKQFRDEFNLQQKPAGATVTLQELLGQGTFAGGTSASRDMSLAPTRAPLTLDQALLGQMPGL